MFNLSKNRKVARHEEWQPPRDKDVPKEWSKQHEFHTNMIRKVIDDGAGPLSGEDPEIIQTQALRYVAKMLNKCPDDPSSVSLSKVMGKYMEYLEKYDIAYLKQLKFLTERIARDPDLAKEMVENATSQAQAPQPMAPAAPGAGQPPGLDLGLDQVPLGMAAENNKATKLSGNRLYLKRPNKPYSLKGTVADKILHCLSHYPKEDGMYYALRVEKEELEVPRTSVLASVAINLHSKMPHMIRKTICSFLKDHGVNDSGYLSRRITEDYLEHGSLDLRPVSIRLGGLGLGVLLYEGVKGITEPEEVKELRERIGSVTEDFVGQLKSALSMEDIDFEEIAVQMPIHTEHGSKSSTEKQSKYPTRPTRTLSREDISSSLDVRSLMMTSTSHMSSTDEKKIALKRLVEVIAFHPSAYEQHRLGRKDIRLINREDDLDKEVARLTRFSRLFESDDDNFLREYKRADESDRRIIVAMAARQNRRNIIGANPWMVIGTKNGQAFVDGEAFGLIDPNDNEGLEVICKILELSNEGKVRLTSIMAKKASEALYKTNNENLLSLSIGSKSFLPFLAVVLMAEQGECDTAVHKLKMLSQSSVDACSSARILAMAAIAKNATNNDAIRNAMEMLDVKPSTLAKIAGKELGLKCIRASSLDWDGTKLPHPSKILSLTDDPMPLVRSYHELAKAGDDNGLAGLKRMFHLVSQEPELDEKLSHLLDYLREALTGQGEKESVLDALVPETRSRTTARMLPDGSLLVKKGGAYCVTGTSIVFSCSPEEAEMVAVKEISIKEKHDNKTN